MVLERHVPADASAKLRVIGDQFGPEFVRMRGVLPTHVVAEGTVEEMIRHVLDQPPERAWRYFLAYDGSPYLTAEEMLVLNARFEWGRPPRCPRNGSALFTARLK